MNANIKYVSNPDLAMNYSMGGMHSRETSDYLRNSYRGFMDRAREAGSRMYNTVRKVYDYYTNSRDIREVKETLYASDRFVDENNIYHVTRKTVGRSGHRMRRYLMAEPEVHRLYRNNRCNGYNDEFLDVDPEVTNYKFKSDYIDVMDGMDQYNDEDEGYRDFYGTSNENELDLEDRFIIESNWNTMREMIASGIDPTDSEGGEL